MNTMSPAAIVNAFVRLAHESFGESFDLPVLAAFPATEQYTSASVLESLM